MEGPSKFNCQKFPKVFDVKKSLNRHMREVHGEEKKYQCQYCNKQYARKQNRNLHSNTCHLTVGCRLPSIQQSCIKPKVVGLEPVLLKSLFKGAMEQWTINVPGKGAESFGSLKISAKAMKATILKYLHKHGPPLKYYLAVRAIFYKASHPGVFTDPPVFLQTQPVTVYPATDLEEKLESDVAALENMIDEYERNGSGWVLDYIEGLDTNIVSINVLK